MTNGVFDFSGLIGREVKCKSSEERRDISSSSGTEGPIIAAFGSCGIGLNGKVEARIGIVVLGKFGHTKIYDLSEAEFKEK